MKCNDILDNLLKVMPKELAMSWDNVGLLAGSKEREVKNIVVCLDLSEKLIEKAISLKADLIVSHHPLIFSPIKNVTDETSVGKRLVSLIKNDISYIALHTNYDIAAGCMSDLVAERIELRGEPLEKTASMEEEDVGIGKVGDLEKPLKISEIAKLVKERFKLPHLRVFDGGEDRFVSRIAISPGSGKGMYKAAYEKRASLLISGDISHHDAVDALELGVATIDAGHYGLEHIFIADMAQRLRNMDKAFNVFEEDITFPDRIA
jgi:dinuclear metal center protein, YbgI family